MTDDIKWIKTHYVRMGHGGCGLRAGVKYKNIVYPV
jgi:hypothetical protein